MTTKHGHSRRNARTRAYEIWTGIRKRCKNHPRYAGRGIGLCDRWQDFAAFLADMGEPPDGVSLDRIDNAGHYEPGNCRWATAAQQARNKHNNINVTYGGRTMCLKDWARELGLPYPTIRLRLLAGWGVERAFTERVRHGRSTPRKLVEFRGQRRAMSDLAAEFGIGVQLIYSRLHAGWDLERALTQVYRPRQSVAAPAATSSRSSK